MDILHSLKKLIKPKEEAFRWYFGLVYLLIITIPFNHKEAFAFYDPDLVWSKYVLIILAATGVIYFLLNFRNYVKDIFFLFLISFVGFQILSLFQTGDLISSLRLIAFQTAIAFTYIPVRNYLYERKEGLRDLILLYGFVFIPVVIFLCVQIYLESQYQTAIGGVWPVPGYPTRYGSTFWDINHFGAFCSALILIIIGFLMQKKISKSAKAFLASILIFALISLHLTSSRSALIGFVAGFLSVGIIVLKNYSLKIKDRFQYVIQYFTTIIAVPGFLYLLYWKADALKESLLYRSVSFFSHLFLLKVGIIVGIQNFALGIGANSFHAYFRHTEWANVYYYIDRAALDLKLPLHNLWLEVLAETGLISFIVFLALWVLLLFGLYRLYKSKNDYLALGFLGAIVSFLTAGFMYSYKSEFFWLFVLIAAAYVSRTFFNKDKLNFSKSLKEILCSGSCDIGKAVLLVLSIFSFIVPLIFITHPLNSAEIGLFSGAFAPNMITDKYTQLLMLFKYIIGNYTYTGRTLSFLFYLGSISLLIVLLRRYFGIFYAVVITSVIFGIANIIEPNLIVSIKFYLVFVLLSASGILVLLASFVNRDPHIFELSKKNSNLVFITTLSVIIILGLISNNLYYKKSYDTNLTFLLELSYNRGLMDQSLIQVDDVNLEGVYYFADVVRRNDKGFYTQEGDVRTIEGPDMSYYDKNLFVFTQQTRDEVEKLVAMYKENPSVDMVELKQGNYYLLFLEKKSNPVPQLQ